MESRIPNFLKPTKKAQEYFGFYDTVFSYYLNREIFCIRENSGIIRSGFTLEFYLDFKTYFYETDQLGNPL